MNERIKELREKLGLTQEEFGKKIGSARNTIANYEMGKRTPGNAVILSICREFNVDEKWLRNGYGEMFIQISQKALIYNHFGYLMENASPQKKAVLSALTEMVYYLPDDKWDYIFDQFNECLAEARTEKEG